LREVPVRENTQAMYLEAKDIRDVRKKLTVKPYNGLNIEFIQPLTGKFLEFEKKTSDYKLEKI
jgi:DNA-dependent RNA polymerase auxiliary subunit epsilon